MRTFSCLLLFFLFSQLSFGSGHFEYLIKEDGVYGGAYGGFTKIEGADPKTFEFINPAQSAWGLVVTYAKDKNRVYYYNTVIEGADPETFEIVWRWYVKDKNHVYTAQNHHKIYENYDAATFEFLGNWFIKDKNGVYYEHNLSKEPIQIENADPDSFEILWGTEYLKDKNRVYYYQEAGLGKLNVKELKGADPETFAIEDASSPYTRDSLNVYWRGEKLPDADANTFKLMMKTAYGTDGKNVYFQSKKLEDAELKTLRIKDRDIATSGKYVYFDGVKLDGLHSDNYVPVNKYYPYYLKNDSIVYYRTTRIKMADAATFEETGGWGDKAKDKNHRYIEAEIDPNEPIIFGIYPSGIYFNNSGSMQLPDADPATFKILNKYYGKDKKAVYWMYSRVEGVNLATFKPISDMVGQDAKAVYYGYNKIVGVNPNTYTLINDHYGKDNRNAFYKKNTMKNVDILSIEGINNIYAKDKNKVFFEDKTIENSDPKSFEYIDYLFSKDGNNVYYEEKKIEKADPETFSNCLKFIL